MHRVVSQITLFFTNATVSYVVFLAILVALAGYGYCWFQRRHNIRFLHGLVLVVVFLLAGYYFGFTSLLLFITLIIGALLASFKISKLRDDIFSYSFVWFFIGTFVFTVLSLVANPILALTALTLASVGLMLYRFGDNRVVISYITTNSATFFNCLTILDWWLLAFSFFIGSQPQSMWDAIHANLYTAKWYSIANSFAPVTESISSLFPQNAISYYSLFYLIGGFKVLQIAYLIPLILVLGLVKKLITTYTIRFPLSLLFSALVVTPIVIFQAATGYYDLLIAAVLLLACYLLLVHLKNNPKKTLLISSFLFGFAAGMKYFPILFILLPALIYWFLIKKPIRQKMLGLAGCLIFTSLPLGIWLLRAYLVTHSPVFPFFQTYFPTPHFWPAGDLLEQNFMIQTKLSATTWLLGGFIIYPFVTYFKTSNYLEAVNGYPGIIYMFLLVPELFFLGKAAYAVIKKRPQPLDSVFLYTFAVYFGLGIITRYYRYLWPYQFLLGLLTLIYIAQLNLSKTIQKMIALLAVLVLCINAVNIKAAFTYFKVDKDKLLRPDYDFTQINPNNPILFINQATGNNIRTKILDLGKYSQPRVYLAGRVYQCDWYWIGVVDQMANARKDPSYAKQLLNQFDYVITSQPIEDSNALCVDLLTKATNLRPIFRNNLTNIYAVDKR